MTVIQLQNPFVPVRGPGPVPNNWTKTPRAPGGAPTGVASIDVIGDTDDEFPEAFLVSFRNPTGATLGGFFGLGAGLILDDD